MPPNAGPLPPEPGAASAAPTANPAPPDATRQPLAARIQAYRPLLGLALAVFAADQATKLWIAARVPFNPLHAHGGGNDILLVRGFAYLIHVGNTGAAWSIFSGRSVLLALLAAATLAAIYFWRRALGLRERIAQVCFGLLCGGIVGNLVDRLLHGHVIDFIDLHFGSYIYPTFNVADCGICVGVILYLLQSLRQPK
ncbi:MAG: signal peptidase II [Verrucomicrobia bacterium]|nr:signal peptidase II [Verrucomicrobiota bacterium]